MNSNELNTIFSETAESIRSKTGSTTKITPTNFATEISSIETGTTEALLINTVNFAISDRYPRMEMPLNIFFFKDRTYIRAAKPDHKNWSEGYKEYSFETMGNLVKNEGWEWSEWSFRVVEDNDIININLYSGRSDVPDAYNYIICLKEIEKGIMAFDHIETEESDKATWDTYVEVVETDEYINIKLKEGYTADINQVDGVPVSIHLYEPLTNASELE
jgi:hypothetical protein